MSENSVKKFIKAINAEDVDAAINLIETSGLLHSNNWLSRYKFLKQSEGDKDDDNNQCNSDRNLLRLLLHRASKEFVTKMFKRAVTNRKEIVTSFLLEDVPNKIDVNAYDEDGKTALHTACVWGSTILVYILLDHDADIHAKCTKSSNPAFDPYEGWREDFGKTALHLAAQYGNSEVIEMLLACGAEVHATDAAGSTCLHLACDLWALWDNYKNASVLLEAGANCNAKDNLGRTPLHIAATNTVVDATTALDCAKSGELPEPSAGEVLKKHIIAMKALDLYVSDGNLKHIDLNGRDRKTFEEYKKELALKICRSKISFYDFLTGSTKQLVVYLQDENLCVALEKLTGNENICCKDHRMICCPLYRDKIVERYNHGKERKRLLSLPYRITATSKQPRNDG